MKDSTFNTYFRSLNVVFVTIYLVYIIFWQAKILRNFESGDNFLFFAKQTVNWDYIVSRYTGWSSRLLFEISLVPISKDPILFSAVNITIMCLVPFVLWRLLRQFGYLKQRFWVVLCLIMLYPLAEMRSAGWVATLANYYYPLLFALIALFLIPQSKHTINYSAYAMLNMCLLFACNVEQLCVTMILVFSYQLITTKRFRYFLLPLMIALSSLLFILITPGNQLRTAFSIYEYLPDYVNYPFIFKAYLGFEATMQHYLYKANAPFLALLLSLIIFAYKKWGTSLRLVPVILIATVSTVNLPHQYLSTVTDQYDGEYWLGYVFFGLSVCAFLYLLAFLYELIDDTKLAINLMIILFLGFCARFIMGFSPTIFASSKRTFIFTDFAIIIVTAVLVDILLTQRHCKQDHRVVVNPSG